MVIQNISSDQKTTDITFTVKRDDVSKTKTDLKEKSEIKYKEIILPKCCKIYCWSRYGFSA